ncbi:hypothetical protein BpHYR1_053197, partial [Brachionus plicatilis]
MKVVLLIFGLVVHFVFGAYGIVDKVGETRVSVNFGVLCGKYGLDYFLYEVFAHVGSDFFVPRLVGARLLRLLLEQVDGRTRLTLTLTLSGGLESNTRLNGLLAQRSAHRTVLFSNGRLFDAMRRSGLACNCGPRYTGSSGRAPLSWWHNGARCTRAPDAASICARAAATPAAVGSACVSPVRSPSSAGPGPAVPLASELPALSPPPAAVAASSGSDTEQALRTAGTAGRAAVRPFGYCLLNSFAARHTPAGS